jgi:hypothetical protein
VAKGRVRDEPPPDPSTALPGQKNPRFNDMDHQKKGLQKKTRIVTIETYGQHLNIFAAPN